MLRAKNTAQASSWRPWDIEKFKPWFGSLRGATALFQSWSNVPHTAGCVSHRRKIQDGFHYPSDFLWLRSFANWLHMWAFSNISSELFRWSIFQTGVTLTWRGAGKFTQNGSLKAEWDAAAKSTCARLSGCHPSWRRWPLCRRICWQVLAQLCAQRGLECPQFGPISGLFTSSARRSKSGSYIHEDVFPHVPFLGLTLATEISCRYAKSKMWELRA